MRKTHRGKYCPPSRPWRSCSSCFGSCFEITLATPDSPESLGHPKLIATFAGWPRQFAGDCRRVLKRQLEGGQAAPAGKPASLIQFARSLRIMANAVRRRITARTRRHDKRAPGSPLPLVTWRTSISRLIARERASRKSPVIKRQGRRGVQAIEIDRCLGIETDVLGMITLVALPHIRGHRNL